MYYDKTHTRRGPSVLKLLYINKIETNIAYWLFFCAFYLSLSYCWLFPGFVVFFFFFFNHQVALRYVNKFYTHSKTMFPLKCLYCQLRSNKCASSLLKDDSDIWEAELSLSFDHRCLWPSRTFRTPLTDGINTAQSPTLKMNTFPIPPLGWTQSLKCRLHWQDRCSIV